MKEADKRTIGGIEKTANYLILLLVFPFCFLGCSTNNNVAQGGTPIQKERRFYEESGLFSIIPPETWKTDEMPGLQYKAIITQGKRGDTSTIVFATEIFDGQLNLFVDNSLVSINSLFGGNISLMQRSDFVTLKNVRGEKTIAHVSMHGQNLRQFAYYLPGKDDLFMIIICTVSTETSYDYYNEMFDRMAKTFEWTNDDPTQPGKRFYEESGGFSIIPPETWRIEKAHNFKYRILRKQNDQIVFGSERFNELNTHVDFVLGKFNDGYGGNISLIQRSEFVTLRNIKGEKIIIDIPMGRQIIRFFIYFLPGKDMIVMTITCSAISEANYDYYNEIFDKMVKTFEWINPSN